MARGRAGGAVRRGSRLAALHSAASAAVHSPAPRPCPRLSTHHGIGIDVLVGTGGAINQKTGRGQS